MVTESKPATIQLALDVAESTELLRLLERSLSDARVEVHRTHTPEFREGVKHQEHVFNSVLAKLRKARS